MREALTGDSMSRTLLVMGAWATTKADTGDLDTRTPCKYPASPVPIPGVHIEGIYGTRGCPGVVGTCDYRSELIYIPIVMRSWVRWMAFALTDWRELSEWG